MFHKMPQRTQARMHRASVSIVTSRHITYFCDFFSPALCWHIDETSSCCLPLDFLFLPRVYHVYVNI